MHNSNLNLDKALLFPRKQITRLKNWKPWRALTTIEFNIFSWSFAQVFSIVCEMVFGIFFIILFRSWAINKNVKNLVSFSV